MTEVNYRLESRNALSLANVDPSLELLFGPVEDILVVQTIMVEFAVIPTVEDNQFIVFAHPNLYNIQIC